MNPTTADSTQAMCPSALALDQFLASDLDPQKTQAIAQHLGRCARCQERQRACQEERAHFVPDLGLVAKLHRPPALRTRHWPKAALSLGAAAAVVIALNVGNDSEEPTARWATPKGGPSASFYVVANGVVRRAAPQEKLASGDVLQVAVSTAEPAFVAVLSRDGAGTVSSYVPPQGGMVKVEAGDHVPLPNSTRLDDVVGPEHISVYFCREAVVASALAAAFSTQQTPQGCRVLGYDFTKVPR